MAKLTIKELERKTKYYLKWFIITRDSNHGRKCAIGTVLYKDSKISFALTPQNMLNSDGKAFTLTVPVDFVSLDLHLVTREEYRYEYQQLVNFLLSCNQKQLEYVAKQWSALTLSTFDEVEDMIDNIIWPYLNR